MEGKKVYDVLKEEFKVFTDAKNFNRLFIVEVADIEMEEEGNDIELRVEPDANILQACKLSSILGKMCEGTIRFEMKQKE